MTDTAPKPDAINPRHYRDHASGIQCIEISEHLGFCLGNALKYCWRAGQKQGEPLTQDLEKALWYIGRESAGLLRHKRPWWCSYPAFVGLKKDVSAVLAHEKEGTLLHRLLSAFDLGASSYLDTVSDHKQLQIVETWYMVVSEALKEARK